MTLEEVTSCKYDPICAILKGSLVITVCLEILTGPYSFRRTPKVAARVSYARLKNDTRYYNRQILVKRGADLRYANIHRTSVLLSSI